jgi:hypothetical protein
MPSRLAPGSHATASAVARVTGTRPSPNHESEGEMRKAIAAVATAAIVIIAGTGVASAESKAAKWARYSTSTMPHLSALQDDLEAVSDSAYDLDVTGVSIACASLSSDVDDAYPVLTRSPSKSLNRILRSVLDYYGLSAEQCLDGDYVSATDAMTQGTDLMTQATIKIRSLAPSSAY